MRNPRDEKPDTLGTLQPKPAPAPQPSPQQRDNQRFERGHHLPSGEVVYPWRPSKHPDDDTGCSFGDWGGADYA